jgi:hypothetical protein
MGQQESTVSGFSPFPISTKRDLYTNRDMMRTVRDNKNTVYCPFKRNKKRPERTGGIGGEVEA